MLILDEPASGLDPRARIEIREILRVLQGMGKTIFISSHILPELEEVCTRVAILDRGRLVWSGRPADGLSQGERLPRVRVRPAGARRAEALEALQAHPRVTRAVLDGEDVLVTLAGREDTAALVARALLARDIDVVRLAEDRPSLEEVFLQVTGRETGGAGEGGGTEEKS
ncbi:MAG: DUF4162 domain-containing protein [Planctomycetes bacterium]|nr:DUF4162 domain-containing protein [Planctomycetota bacterium]